MANDTKTTTDTIVKLILDIYGLVSPKSTFESVKNNLTKMKPAAIRKQLKSGELRLFLTFPPFTDVTFKSIKSAADHLEIPLDEKVFIPELGTTTKEPVPVGVTYSQALEQTAEIYSNIRSTGKYQSLTGQATKGKIKNILIVFSDIIRRIYVKRSKLNWQTIWQISSDFQIRIN